MNFLEHIVQYKREEVRILKRKVGPAHFRDMKYFTRKPLSLKNSLASHPPFGIIAEIKRSSPSAGAIDIAIDPVQTACRYEEAGAAGISVLTDHQFFSGSLDDLLVVRGNVSLPVLRKDFIIDEVQIVEAKGAGADAILLIAAVLEREQLADLFTCASELGLECLVELYESHEIDILDFDRMHLIGINNRDLRTFQTDLEHSLSIARELPKDITIVSESGIRSAADLARLSSCDIQAALIGEYFMRSGSPGKALKELLDEFSTSAAAG